MAGEEFGEKFLQILSLCIPPQDGYVKPGVVDDDGNVVNNDGTTSPAVDAFGNALPPGTAVWTSFDGTGVNLGSKICDPVEDPPEPEEYCFHDWPTFVPYSTVITPGSAADYAVADKITRVCVSDAPDGQQTAWKVMLDELGVPEWHQDS